MTASAHLQSLGTSLKPDPGPDPALMRAIGAACRRIAPLWPLKNFVAVNPFLGFSSQSFAATAADLKRIARTRMLMPRAFYRDALVKGGIDDTALAAALAVYPDLGLDVAGVKRAAAVEPDSQIRPPAVVATVAEILDRLADGDRHRSLVGFMIDEISSFCAAYFDEGQANWRMPHRAIKPYAAWRVHVQYDRSAEAMGIRGFRSHVLSLPAEPVAAIGAVMTRLGIPPRAIEDYLVRALFDIGGWAAYARYRGWASELDGASDDTLRELLAIRQAWAWGLFAARTDADFRSAWSEAMIEAARLPAAAGAAVDAELALDLVLHEAYEITHRRSLVQKLATRGAHADVIPLAKRPAVQAAFCIDVRSEIFRRAFEAVAPETETIGFAGFFGFPIEYVPIGMARGTAQCPVLLKPAFTVCEAIKGADPAEEAMVLDLRLMRRRASKAWKSFKSSAVSSFVFVETAGLGFAAKLATDSTSLTRPAPSPSIEGLDAHLAERLAPRIDPRSVEGRPTGFTPEQRLTMAETVLKAMSMRPPFARLVLLAGHGSTTVNNPHASGLDCGACGGHTGEANARVAAAILNDPDIRCGLASRGLPIPEDCWFLGALHDTTTDAVRIFDEDHVPASLHADLATLKSALAEAGRLARRERSALLGIERDDPDRAVLARSKDWAQVRPEWGLAGNRAFIAAPRRLTRGLDLEGRAFLHSYDHGRDEGYSVLELIMTAPMVVASWINLQYFGSTVNNAAFGSGNKVLHNVVGQLGVLEGNAGDLRTGLPWQSVHDGTRLMHEPLRLNVFIAAPQAAMDAVLAKHASVHDLVANRWLFLHSLSDDGRTIRRWHGPADWRPA